MTLTLRPLQAITNAPAIYDYAWMHTLIDNIAVDQKGKSCRLVENDDQWHFEQHLLRYRSGLNLVITDQEQLDGFLRRGWLKLTDDPIVIHRIKVDLEEAFDWDDDRRHALLECLHSWRDQPTVKYTTGRRTDYYFECRGDEIAGELRSQLESFGLAVESWGPSPVHA